MTDDFKTDFGKAALEAAVSGHSVYTSPIQGEVLEVALKYSASKKIKKVSSS